MDYEHLIEPGEKLVRKGGPASKVDSVSKQDVGGIVKKGGRYHLAEENNTPGWGWGVGGRWKVSAVKKTWGINVLQPKKVTKEERHPCEDPQTQAGRHD